jgi:hypothetical protein
MACIKWADWILCIPTIWAALPMGWAFDSEAVAYVDDQNTGRNSSWTRNRYTTRPGKPVRNRTVKSNLDLFRRMRAGEFKDGEKKKVNVQK